MVLIQEIVTGEVCHSDMFIGPPHLVRNIQPQCFTLLVGVLVLHNPGVGLVEVGLLDFSKVFAAIILWSTGIQQILGHDISSNYNDQTSALLLCCFLLTKYLINLISIVPSLLYLPLADYRRCCCCSHIKCYSCYSEAGPKVILERF